MAGTAGLLGTTAGNRRRRRSLESSRRRGLLQPARQLVPSDVARGTTAAIRQYGTFCWRRIAGSAAAPYRQLQQGRSGLWSGGKGGAGTGGIAEDTE